MRGYLNFWSIGNKLRQKNLCVELSVPAFLHELWLKLGMELGVCTLGHYKGHEGG